jgi:hypothetical protein
MALQRFVRITTSDTEKTYQFPPGNAPQPPDLWEVTLTIKSIDKQGWVSTSSVYEWPKGTVHLERETLENAGVLPKPMDTPTKEEPEETVEDLILRLLEHVGYFPCQCEI